MQNNFVSRRPISPSLHLDHQPSHLCHRDHCHRLTVDLADFISIVRGPTMASSYSIEDQAADLGIHRIHSLVLGDSRKEAHIPTRFSLPTPKRPVVGHGDSRHDDWNYENEQKRELLRIARRQNLTRYPHEMKPGQKQATSLSSMVAFPVIAKIRRLDSNYEDADTLTRKIAAWKSMLLRCFFIILLMFQLSKSNTSFDALMALALVTPTEEVSPSPQMYHLTRQVQITVLSLR